MNSNELPRLRLRLTAPAESAVRSGHPWVFAESIVSQNRPGQLGELAVIYDRKDRFLALGLYDPHSPLRLRVLHTGKPQTVDRQWWSRRLRLALDRRKGLFDAETTGYRCINGESDGWPGLVLDRYDRTLVLKLYTAAWFHWFDDTVRLITEELRPERIVLRLSGNVQDLAGAPDTRTEASERRSSRGNEALNSRVSERHRMMEPRYLGCYGRQEECRLDGLTDGQILHGPPAPPAVHFLETGLRFEADVLRGQKTGFFLDQRDNRRQVERLAGGRAVLNAFSFTGGFSLYAARGGARSVTDLDSSAHALAGAQRNFALNASDSTLASCRHECVQAEAFAWLGENPKRKFDLIVLDPPSLARREAERAGAIRAYAKLALSGIAHLSPGGILVACSCSAHVSPEEFFAAVRQSAARSRRNFRELLTTAHPPDHPATFKEAQYLKAVYLRLG